MRAGVLDSVRAHLLADVEVGIFLSAGVDSGALLGCMRDAGQREIRAITLAFEEFRGTSEDEAPLAAQVCERYGARHVVRHLSQQEFVEDLPAILEAMDQPSIDGVNTWFVSKAAKEAGLKVAISGLGGDELLGGYPSFVDVPRWRRRFGALAACRGSGFLRARSSARVAPGFSRARPKALGLLEYSGTWAGAYLLRRGLFLPHELPEVMDPEIAREGMRRLKPLASSRRESYARSRVRTSRGSACLSRRTTCAISFCGTPIGRGWRTALRFACRSSTSQLLGALAPAIPALTPGRGQGCARRSAHRRRCQTKS